MRFLFVFIGTIASTLFLPAQDYPYPESPGNTNIINTVTPTLIWKASDNYPSYKIEIFKCNYDEGSSFESLELENYVYADVKNGPFGYEASALTYNLRRPGNYTTVDDAGAGFRDYTNNFTSSQFIPANFLSGNDFEGLTYLYNDYYAMVEERLDYLIFLKFNYNNQNLLTGVTEVNTIQMNNPFIALNQNKNWEGITYNPRSGKLYLAKEKDVPSLYQTNLPSGSDFSGGVNLSQPFILNNTSWGPSDVSGLFHLSLDIDVSATPAGNHILILSEEEEKMYEVDLNGTLISEKDFNADALFGSISNGNFKAEGITFQDGVIWVTSDTSPNEPCLYYKFVNFNYSPPQENTNGLIHTQSNVTGNQYQVPAGILFNNTEYCWRVTGLDPNGPDIPGEYYSFTANVVVPGCMDTNACNYDPTATIPDTSCKYTDCKGDCGGLAVVGASCNDNNAQTNFDQYNSNCECVGTPITIDGCTDLSACNYNPTATVDDGSCLYYDCLLVCGGTKLPGASCNDFNPLTINDKYNNNCVCIGDLRPGCNNPLACNYDPLAAVNDGSCITYVDCNGVCGGTASKGSPCDDGDPLTANDVYDDFCNCGGIKDIVKVCFEIKHGNDDAEEMISNGSIDFTSNDMDLADISPKVIGLRFSNVNIPSGANILNAYLQFMADETNNQQTNITLSIENTGNSSPITSSNYNISSRNYINDVVQWNNVLSWQAGDNGGAQRSPSIATLVQQVINKNNWQANNSTLIKITGTGKRAATSFNSGYPAPQLCVEYMPFSCPQNLSLNGIVTNNQTISVENEIESNATIVNAIVNYFAGDEIDLLPGFSVDKDKNFTASIQNCQ